MRLYIIRHGDPDYDLDTLTPSGKKQAEALAKRLKEEGITKIYSSPLGRAVDTMHYTSERLGIEPTILDWTEELSGMDIVSESHGDFKAWNIPGELVLNTNNLPNHTTWEENPLFTGLNISSTYEELISKSDGFLSSLGYERDGRLYKMNNPNEERVAVFCHGALTRTWLSHLLSIPLSIMWVSFWLSPTSVTTIVFEERSKDYAVPRCIGFSDVSHLYESGLGTSYMGIPANIY